jgi:predicted amidophosphoribosyltransferase
VPSVQELTAVYGNFMLNPRRGQGVCEICLNLTDDYSTCYACAHGPQCLDAVAPISYSVAREQLHHALASYKRLTGEVARRLQAQLAAVLWRFLARHEGCVVGAAHERRFTLVTTVPSGDRERDEHHPLRRIVSEVVGQTRDRYERLLERSEHPVPPREFMREKFTARRQLDGEAVLLIDDTWTTGASAQSAAAALKSAGAGTVAAVVIGRHLNREWHENDRRLRGITRPFDWDCCALCDAGRLPRAPTAGPTGAPAARTAVSAATTAAASATTAAGSATTPRPVPSAAPPHSGR